MAWFEYLDLMNKTVRDTFGFSATAHLISSVNDIVLNEVTVNVRVIFDYESVVENIGGGESVVTTKPVVSVYLADLPRLPRKGDYFEVQTNAGQVRLVVDEVHDDSSGMIKCYCLRDN